MQMCTNTKQNKILWKEMCSSTFFFCASHSITRRENEGTSEKWSGKRFRGYRLTEQGYSFVGDYKHRAVWSINYLRCRLSSDWAWL